MRRIVLASAVLTLFAFILPAAQSPDVSSQQQMEARAKSALESKELVLRDFYCDNHLQFSAAGELVKAGSPGPWTLCAFVNVTSVKLTSDSMEIHANRVVAIYSKKQKAFDHLLTSKEVRIEIGLAPEPEREAKLGATTQKVFLTTKEDFTKLLPDYWSFFFWEASADEKLRRLREWKIPGWDEPQTHDGKEGEGRNKPPVCLWCADPEYTEFARKARLEGMVKLWCIVDEEGKPNNIVLVEPMGAGLDEQALESVQNWKFTPAQRYGRPVPIRMTIEVNFRLNP